jgi:hypothetical protein
MLLLLPGIFEFQSIQTHAPKEWSATVEFLCNAPGSQTVYLSKVGGVTPLKQPPPSSPHSGSSPTDCLLIPDHVCGCVFWGPHFWEIPDTVTSKVGAFHLYGLPLAIKLALPVSKEPSGRWEEERVGPDPSKNAWIRKGIQWASTHFLPPQFLF